LIGDAAHGILPYLAQGAATSIEDGAALAECLDRVQDVSDILNMLQAFQAIRKPRCEAIALGARANGHMADGREQAQRDCEMRQEMDQSSPQSVVNPNKWSDKDFQPWLFGYDTVKLVSRSCKLPDDSKLTYPIDQ
jgi:salicylate hydroxylase